MPVSCSLGGSSRYWQSLVFLGRPLTGIHRAASSLLQLVLTNIPSGDLIVSRLDGLRGRSSAASLCIWGRREEYFVSTGIKTEVWNEKFSSFFCKPRGLSRAPVLTTPAPRRRPRNHPQRSGEQQNWYSSAAASALQADLPQTLLQHRQRNTALATQGPPTTGTLSAKDTVVVISWKLRCYCPVAYRCGHLLGVRSYLRWSRVWAGSSTAEDVVKPPAPPLVVKLVCWVVSCSLLRLPGTPAFTIVANLVFAMSVIASLLLFFKFNWKRKEAEEKSAAQTALETAVPELSLRSFVTVPAQVTGRQKMDCNQHLRCHTSPVWHHTHTQTLSQPLPLKGRAMPWQPPAQSYDTCKWFYECYL